MSGALALGWRNIWRNRRRTIISMVAIGMGLLLVIFYSGVVAGMFAGATTDLDNAGMGHVEITAKGYRPRREVTVSMADPSQWKVPLELPAGAEIGSRVLSRGLATSARGNEPVQIFGVTWADEVKLSAHLHQLKEGALPAGGDERGVLIGDHLAERLNLKVGSKVRLMAQRPDSEIGADLFRVRGIFHSISQPIGQRQVYVSQAAARTLLGVGDVTHVMVIQLPDAKQAEALAATLQGKLGDGFEVLSWGQILPVLKRMEAMTNSIVFAMAIFVYLLVGLGVLNTMLMSVLERTREFGVLMSLGTRARGIVAVVMAESFWIATVSVVVGSALGALLTWKLSQTGLSLGTGGESMAIEGATISSLVKTRFAWLDVLKASSIVYLMALVVGIYPATRITRLQPAEALRRT